LFPHADLLGEVIAAARSVFQVVIISKGALFDGGFEKLKSPTSSLVQ
jgi:hypothetical protein